MYYDFYDSLRPVSEPNQTDQESIEIALAAFNLSGARRDDKAWLQLICFQAFKANDESLPLEVLTGKAVTQKYPWWKLQDGGGSGTYPSRRMGGKNRYEVNYVDLKTGETQQRHVEAWDSSRALLRAFGHSDTAKDGNDPRAGAERLKAEIGVLNVKPKHQRYQLISVARVSDDAASQGIDKFMVETEGEGPNEKR